MQTHIATPTLVKSTSTHIPCEILHSMFSNFLNCFPNLSLRNGILKGVLPSSTPSYKEFLIKKWWKPRSGSHGWRALDGSIQAIGIKGGRFNTKEWFNYQVATRSALYSTTRHDASRTNSDILVRSLYMLWSFEDLRNDCNLWTKKRWITALKNINIIKLLQPPWLYTVLE